MLPDDIAGFVADICGTVNFTGDFDVLFVMTLNAFGLYL